MVLVLFTFYKQGVLKFKCKTAVPNVNLYFRLPILIKIVFLIRSYQLQTCLLLIKMYISYPGGFKVDNTQVHNRVCRRRAALTYKAVLNASPAV